MLTKEKVLEALDRMHYGSFRSTDLNILRTFINSHFEMVEKLRKHSKYLDPEIAKLVNDNFWELG